MSLPNDSKSTSAVPYSYSYAINDIKDTTVDYETGGIDLQDSSQGLTYQKWVGFLTNDNKTVVLQGLTTGDRYEVLTVTNPITWLSIAFDVNMNHALAFVENGQAKYNWFDSTVSSQVTTNLGATDKTPRMSIDDRRDSQNQRTDIILAYIRDDDLYYRQQRDRYTIERLLLAGAGKGLLSIGFTRGYRFQFSLIRP